MKTVLKIEGGAELAAALNRMPTKLSKRVKREALQAAGEPIQKSMSQLAPREPGAPDMADHISMSTTKVEGLIDNDQTAAIAIGPERDFYYGLFQEEGTAHHGAQPFARPAFDQNVNRALTVVVDELWWALRKDLP